MMRAGAVLRFLHAVGACASMLYVAGIVWLMWWVVVAVVTPSWSPVVITSGSMAPRIRTGDIVVTAALHPSLLRAGDVITFHDPDRGLVTHRLVGWDARGALQTKGDANTVADPAPVAPGEVVGRGRLLVPAIGRPLVWLHEGAVAALGAWSGLTVAAWWCLRSWLRQAGPPADPPRATSSVTFAGASP